MSMRSPLIFELSADCPAVTITAVNAISIGEVPESGTVTEVSILPNAAVTANTTSYRTLTVYNRGTTGTGTVAVAAIDTSTTGFTDNDERLATLASAANLLVPESAVLEVVETVAGSGVAHGGYKITTKVSRT